MLPFSAPDAVCCGGGRTIAKPGFGMQGVHVDFFMQSMLRGGASLRAKTPTRIYSRIASVQELNTPLCGMSAFRNIALRQTHCKIVFMAILSVLRWFPKTRESTMIIKMLLEEAGQFFYCEARKMAPHSFEGIAHFLHKVGDGNAFVRGKSYPVSEKFETRADALIAAECYGKHIASQHGRICGCTEEQSNLSTSLQSQARPSCPTLEETAR
jgi:hypothetical protein